VKTVAEGPSLHGQQSTNLIYINPQHYTNTTWHHRGAATFINNLYQISTLTHRSGGPVPPWSTTNEFNVNLKKSTTLHKPTLLIDKTITSNLHNMARQARRYTVTLTNHFPKTKLEL
jgi:hypothetical protein